MTLPETLTITRRDIMRGYPSSSDRSWDTPLQRAFRRATGYHYAICFTFGYDEKTEDLWPRNHPGELFISHKHRSQDRTIYAWTRDCKPVARLSQEIYGWQQSFDDCLPDAWHELEIFLTNNLVEGLPLYDANIIPDQMFFADGENAYYNDAGDIMTWKELQKWEKEHGID